MCSVLCGVGTIVMSEVWAIVGERALRCRAKMEQGCQAMEMTSLPLPIGYVLVDTVSIRQNLLDTLSEIHPSMISKTKPNM